MGFSYGFVLAESVSILSAAKKVIMLVPLAGNATSNRTNTNANMTNATWVTDERCLNFSNQWF